MSSILLTAVGLVVVASFFLAYMSFKTWRIFQVILVVLIVLAMLPFYYLAAQVLKTHQEWQLLVKDQKSQLEKLAVANHDLIEGAVKKDPQLVGIRELKLQLHEILRDRGEVWRGVTPDKIDEKGAVELSTKEPDPNGIVPKMVLFIFEEAPASNQGHFLGEFKVGEASGKTVKLEPNLPLDEAGLEQLKKSRGPWTLYATMPIGPRDYPFLFWEYHKQRVVMDGAIALMKDNVDRIVTAVKQAQDEVKYRRAEKADLAADLAKFKHETEIVNKYLATLQQQYQGLRETLKATYFANVKMAADIAMMQLQAAEAIERRAADQAKADGVRPPARP
jgi:hypothetical protein